MDTADTQALAHLRPALTICNCSMQFLPLLCLTPEPGKILAEYPRSPKRCCTEPTSCGSQEAYFVSETWCCL